MNTNNIKYFAKEARLILMEGVKQRLTYWGFEDDGSNNQKLESTYGGYDFRGEVYNDPSIPVKWNKLKKRTTDKQAVKDVIEEASYTWFNRLMAIKILEENGYIAEQLKYTAALRTPLIVQNAKRGQHTLTKQADKDLLLEYLRDEKEEQAFGLLITDFCHSNSLMHDVFGRIDDYTEMLLPSNLLQTDGLLDLINSDEITDEEYKEVELIGWLYQFYIADKKGDVFKGFKKNIKARAEDIPAATQIFTPKWIVKYMVENTVGKIYLDYEPTSSLKSEMKYLVDSVSPTGEMPKAEGFSSPLQGEVPRSGGGVISDLTQLTLLDPACGSGHILVTGFDLLFKMYREEGYTAKQAVENILKHNLYGLDIDDRAVQLARFAVLLKAAQHYPAILDGAVASPLQGGQRGVNIFSFPENNIEHLLEPTAISVSKLSQRYIGYYIAEDVSNDGGQIILEDETLIDAVAIKKLEENDITSVLVYTYDDLIGFLDTDNAETVNQAADALWELTEGKNIGSALKLDVSAKTQNLIKQQFQLWDEQSNSATLDIEQTGIWNALKPFLEVLLVITKQYTAVVANPPYMGQKSMNADLKDYVNTHYPKTKSDLMTVFMEVIPNLTLDHSRFALINLPSWLFLSSFEKLREDYINNYQFESLLHMGRGIFGIDFGSVAFAVKKTKTQDALGTYFRLHERNFQHIYYEDIGKLFLYSNGNESYKYDFSQYRGDNGITEIPEQGTENGLKLFYPNIPQTNFSKIPGSPIAYWVSERVIENFQNLPDFNSLANIRQGMATSDNGRFVRFWFEISDSKIGLGYKNRKSAETSKLKWFPYNKGGGYRKWYGNVEYVVNWEFDGKEISEFRDYKNATLSSNMGVAGLPFIFKENITWSKISSSSFSVRYLPEGFLFDVSGCSIYSDINELNYFLLLLNSKVIVGLISSLSPTLNFEVGTIKSIPIKSSKLPLDKNIFVNIAKKDWDSRETSWDFAKAPLLNESNSLKQAWQTWQEQVTQDFFQLHANEEELNRIFIDIYGLQEELTPEVALKDITILQQELDRNALEQLEPVFREQGKDAIALPIDKAEVLSQFISYAIGVFLGRYRLDKPGLNIAHPNPTEEELKSYTYLSPSRGGVREPVRGKGEVSPSDRRESVLDGGGRGEVTIDEDAILPLMGENCAFPDDALVRTKDLILAIWGESTLTENINFLHECLGMDLDKWLTEKFWKYHTKMYKKKPIYWLFTSNPDKPQIAAFKVLVYMHRMDKYTVQKIQRHYFHPHQEYIKRELARLAENEDSLNREEQKQLEMLEDWKIECLDYNEILKDLANQQIEFDLDDGVTVNYAKFDGAVAKI